MYTDLVYGWCHGDFQEVPRPSICVSFSAVVLVIGCLLLLWWTGCPPPLLMLSHLLALWAGLLFRRFLSRGTSFWSQRSCIWNFKVGQACLPTFVEVNQAILVESF